MLGLTGLLALLAAPVPQTAPDLAPEARIGLAPEARIGLVPGARADLVPGARAELMPAARRETLMSVFDAQDPASVARLMREMGLEAELERGESPFIRSRTDDLTWFASFHRCKGGVRCGILLIEASFDLERGLALRRINEWNRDMFIGRAYLDDDDAAVIEHVVVLDGGMSRETFAVVAERWAAVLGEFAEHIGYR